MATEEDCTLCGSEYCGVCETHAHENGVEAWALGQTHTAPEFGDWAQRQVATRRRLDVWRNLQDSNPAMALIWPEFASRDMDDLFIRDFAGRHGKDLQHMLHHVPRFMNYASHRPFAFGGQFPSRRARLRAERKAIVVWRKELISSYIEQQGEHAFIELLELFDDTHPWWWAAEEDRLAA